MVTCKRTSVEAYFLVTVYFFSCSCLAGFERIEGGARSISLGGAFVGMADESWTVFYNPAGLARVSLPEVSVFYSPQPFGLHELQSIALAVSHPVFDGGFGFSLRRFGFMLYRETSIGAGYALEIGDVSVGATLNSHSVTIMNYGSAGSLGIDVGLLLPVTSQIRVGMVARNINAPKIGAGRERIAQTFSVGAAYRPVADLVFVIDHEKEIGFPAALKFGFECWVVDEIALRAGVNTEIASYAAGVGVRYWLVRFDYGFTSHQELGFTHQISVTVQWDYGHE